VRARLPFVLFVVLLGTALILAAAPFWRTHLLPFQDYSNLLLLARAYRDCTQASSPFFGTYERGFAFGPLFLPVNLLHLLGAARGLEMGGRVMWTLYAAGLPLAALDLLRALGRDRWAVLFVFPLIFSYWVTGGFFAFATAAPILVLALSFGVRWLTARAPRDGALLAALGCALHLWHALAFAQFVFSFGVLWILCRHASVRQRLTTLVPLLPSLAMFALWIVLAVLRRAPGSRPPTWTPFFEGATHFFDFIGPIMPGAAGAVVVIGLLLTVGALASPKREPTPKQLYGKTK
jgi:hypothetical protein